MLEILVTFSIITSLISLLFSTGTIQLRDKKEEAELRDNIYKISKQLEENEEKKSDKYKDYRNENGLLTNKNKAFKIIE